MIGLHRWSPAVERVAVCADGNDRSIRRCLRCGAARITVHPPGPGLFPWQEWETPNGEVLKKRPLCVPAREGDT